MTDLIALYDEMLKVTKVDAQLAALCARAAEYARLHLYARKITGCNGLGEIENLLDEFRCMIYETMRYCSEKKYIDELAIYTVEMNDEELTRLGAELGEYL